MQVGAPGSIAMPAPLVTMGQPPGIALPSPAVTVGQVGAVQIGAPAVAVGQPGMVQIPAPAMQVGAPGSIAMPAPLVTMGQPKAEGLNAPRLGQSAEWANAPTSDALPRAKPTPTNVTVGPNHFHISGVSDPEAVARKVISILERRSTAALHDFA